MGTAKKRVRITHRRRKVPGRRGAVGLGWARTRERDSRGCMMLVRVPDEAATVARIRELDATGWSLRGICAQLWIERRPTKKNRRWHPSTILKILARDSFKKG